MALNLYFLRHGQTELSRDGVFCGAGMNPGLTTEGLLMAQSFFEFYAKTNWVAIYASPLMRAQLTAAPLSAAIKMSVISRAELREIEFGKWEGKSISTVQQDFADDYRAWSNDPLANAPSGGETALQIAARMRVLVQEILGKHSDGNVLLVSHKATIRVALCDLLGIDLAKYRDSLACPVASVSVIEFNKRGPLLKELASREHLSVKLRELPGT